MPAVLHAQPDGKLRVQYSYTKGTTNTVNSLGSSHIEDPDMLGPNVPPPPYRDMACHDNSRMGIMMTHVRHHGTRASP